MTDKRQSIPSKISANEILMSIYMCIVSFSFIYQYITDSIPLVLISCLVLFIGFLFLSSFVFSRIASLKISKPENVSDRQVTKITLIISLITFCILSVWFYAYYPGVFSNDPLNQYGQAISHNISDWHPAWQTIVVYLFPLAISGGRILMIVLLQIVCFSFSMGYMSGVIYRYSGAGFMIVTYLFVILNPYVGILAISPLSDVTFAITCQLAVALAFRLAMRRNEAGSKTLPYVILGAIMANATIFRHNGILFTFFMLISLFLLFARREWLVTLISFLIVFVVIKIPVYNCFNVQRGASDVMQVSLLPLTVIGNVTVKAPESLDDETSKFVYAIAPQEEWNRVYETGNFSVVRYYGDIDHQVIEDAGIINIFKMGARCFTTAPKEALEAFFAVTDIVYGPDIKDKGYPGCSIPDNSYGVVMTEHHPVSDILQTYYKIVRLRGYNFFRQSAFILMLVLCATLAICRFNVKTDWRKILFVLPLFTFNFGTMVFLGGPTSRFFFVDYLVFPVMLSALWAFDNTDRSV